MFSVLLISLHQAICTLKDKLNAYQLIYSCVVAVSLSDAIFTHFISPIHLTSLPLSDHSAVCVHVYPRTFYTYSPLKMEQSVPKRRYIKFRRRGITQKKTFNKTILFPHISTLITILPHKCRYASIYKKVFVVYICKVALRIINGLVCWCSTMNITLIELINITFV